MNVSLTPEIEQIISDLVANGRYRSASEVVRAAVRLLEERVYIYPIADGRRDIQSLLERRLLGA